LNIKFGPPVCYSFQNHCCDD